MVMITAKTKKWGNSLGVIIPHEVVEQLELQPDETVELSVTKDSMKEIRELFGTFKTDKSTQEIMDEIDEGWD
jgi:antitoxin component of MazEF toxin-antitoxin module